MPGQVNTGNCLISCILFVHEVCAVTRDNWHQCQTTKHELSKLNYETDF